VDRLIDDDADAPEHDELDAVGPALALRDDIAALRGWWLMRMLKTQRPLQARMAVFWHSHFATSNVKVRSAALMLQQLRVFERHALGRFDELLLAVSRDPAMILWLDGDQNVKGRPNENYARELFELFSLGVGNYSEQDIREAARAFTGWHQQTGAFRFSPAEHDASEKTIFGQRGAFDGADIVRLACARPECAVFLARKLLRELLTPDPPENLVHAVAERLRETRLHIGETLRTLLTSQAFHDPRWRRARIKSPVELVLGAARSLELTVPAQALADAVSQMGQRLFEPPSVKGWDGGRTWLNTATMMVRLNTLWRAVEQASFKPAGLRGRYELKDAAAVAAFCEELTLDGAAPPAVRSAAGEPGADLDELLRRGLRVMMSSPEYQMA
jgi:uncharacterized protein (DUF1800 family)